MPKEPPNPKPNRPVDPNQTKPPEPPAPPPEPPAPPPKTPVKPPGLPLAGERVRDGHGRRIKQLESKINFLENALDEQRTRNEEYERRFETLRGVPSRTNPVKSLLDELDDFVFGEIKQVVPPANAEPPKED